MKGQPQITNIKKEKISNQIYDTLKEFIVSGQWDVGSKIPSENELSEQFGVSRISVRTALQKLETLGLLDIRVGEGTYVTEVSMSSYIREIGSLIFRPKSFKDIMQLRKSIELETAYLASENATPEHLETLEKHLEKLTAAAHKRDVLEYIEQDRLFHRYISTMSGNELFTAMFDFCDTTWRAYIWDVKDDYFAAIFDSGDFRNHQLLLQSIRDRDFDECSKVYRRRITNLPELSQ